MEVKKPNKVICNLLQILGHRERLAILIALGESAKGLNLKEIQGILKEQLRVKNVAATSLQNWLKQLLEFGTIEVKTKNPSFYTITEIGEMSIKFVESLDSELGTLLCEARLAWLQRAITTWD